MNRLSVIVCVYNTNINLFAKCLQSIFSSTEKKLEVIVVDDGSTVDYSAVLKKFDVKYFKTKNQGTLKARMFGIEKSSSPYVCFVDSDDAISFNYFEGSLNEMQDADIIINDWAFDTDHAKYVCLNDSNINSDFASTNPLDKFFEQQGREHSTYVLWNKIFKKEVLVSACREIEKLNFGKLVYAEDVLISYFAYCNSKKVKNTHVGYYFYKIHNSQQVSVQNKKKLTDHIQSLGTVFSCIEEDLKNSNRFEIYGQDVNAWKQMLCSAHYAMAKKYKSKELKELIQTIFVGCELKKSNIKYDFAYFNHHLLPNNIAEIDELLKKVYYSNKQLKIYVTKNTYAHNALIKLKTMFGCKFMFAEKKQADVIFPKENITFKQKLLHNTVVCKIGAILFPKGSKIRAFLKKKL